MLSPLLVRRCNAGQLLEPLYCRVCFRGCPSLSLPIMSATALCLRVVRISSCTSCCGWCKWMDDRPVAKSPSPCPNSLSISSHFLGAPLLTPTLRHGSSHVSLTRTHAGPSSLMVAILSASFLLSLTPSPLTSHIPYLLIAPRARLMVPSPAH
jgi:hypothetical protein